MQANKIAIKAIKIIEVFFLKKKLNLIRVLY